MVRRAAGLMQSLDIVVCDCTYAHSRTNPEEVSAQIAGYLPKASPGKALIFAVRVMGESLYFHAFGRTIGRDFADKVLDTPIDELSVLESQGEFEAMTIRGLNVGPEKIEGWFVQAREWFETFIDCEYIADKFDGQYSIFSSLGPDRVSVEYHELSVRYEFPWEVAMAAILSKFPRELLGEKNWAWLTTYLQQAKINETGS